MQAIAAAEAVGRTALLTSPKTDLPVTVTVTSFAERSMIFGPSCSTSLLRLTTGRFISVYDLRDAIHKRIFTEALMHLTPTTVGRFLREGRFSRASVVRGRKVVHAWAPDAEGS